MSTTELGKNGCLFLRPERIDSVFYLFLRSCQKNRKDLPLLPSDTESLLKELNSAEEGKDYSDDNLLSFLKGEFEFAPDALNELERLSEEEPIKLPRKLFKYKSETNAFPDDELFFSDYRYLNDPLECHQYALFDQNFHIRYSPSLLCLASTCRSAFMWSMYGGGGRGRCLSYPSKSVQTAMKEKVSQTIWPSIVFVGPRKIEYKQLPEILGTTNPLWSARNLIRSMFIKPKTFKEEKEIRFVALKDSNSGQGCKLLVRPAAKYLTDISFLPRARRLKGKIIK